MERFHLGLEKSGRGGLLVSFAGRPTGEWRVLRIDPVAGEEVEPVERLAVVEGTDAAVPADARWVLRGVTGPMLYTDDRERAALDAAQEGLGRAASTRAALIPITKSPAWWSLRLEERRRIFADASRHVAIGMEYLPAVARRLHHGRGLGEPFDFLTWFEYAPEDADAFEELVRRLRETEEWNYVEREVDIRLTRDPD